MPHPLPLVWPAPGLISPPEAEFVDHHHTPADRKRLTALLEERRRIKGIAGMVDRVNGWERLEEMVDAMFTASAARRGS
jgi:hypothetical protein